MIKRLSSYLNFNNTFCGIEHTTQNGTDAIFISELKKDNNKLLISKQLSLNLTVHLAEHNLKNKAISLVINNTNVLFKTIESNQNESSQLINTAFPNITLSDFYFNILSQENKHFIWICRKTYIDTIIETYTKNNSFVTSLYIGNASISNSYAFIKENSIVSSNTLIKKEGSIITDINKLTDNIPETTYNTNGISVNNNYLLSFSAALTDALKTRKTTSNYNSTEAENSFKNARFFSLFSKAGIIFIFLALLINFFFFNYYFNKVNHLSIIAQNNEDNKTSLLKLNTEIEKKQKLVEDLLKMKSSQSSFYINKIVSQIPKTILLKQFIFQPLKTQPRTSKPIQLLNNQITITGSSTNHDKFSNWVSNLEQIEWVENVLIINYGASTKVASNFTIKVSLANEF